MRSKIVTVATLGLIMNLPTMAAEPGPAPQCEHVTGEAGVFFTLDEGTTLTEGQNPLAPNSYAWGITALTETSLIASRDDALYRSDDMGCQWYALEGRFQPMFLTPSTQSTAYGYSFFYNNNTLVKIDQSGVNPIKAPIGTFESIFTVGVDADNAANIRLISTKGSVYTSSDYGNSWQQLSEGIPELMQNGHVRRAAVNATDLDHIVVAAQNDGVFITRDGGRTWQRSEGLPKGDITHQVVMSPADDGQTVWTSAISAQQGNQRTVYLSTDGGQTFKPEFTNSQQVILTNAPSLFPHPTDAKKLYHIFGMSYQGYGTDINVYNAETKTFEHHHYYSFYGANAAGFALGNAEIMYIGANNTLLGLGR